MKNEKNQSQRLCPCCNSEVHGRRNKVFCNDHCRAAYHADRKREEEVVIRSINKILRKNRDILRRLNTRGKTVVNKVELNVLGFDFKHITSTYKTSSDIVYFYCYDEGYRLLDEGRMLLVHHYKSR